MKFFNPEMFLALIINSFLLYFLFLEFKSINFKPPVSLDREKKSNNQHIISLLLFALIILGFIIRVWKIGFDEFDSQEISYLFPFVKELSAFFGENTVSSLKQLVVHPINIFFSHQPLAPILTFIISSIKSGIPHEVLFRIPSVIFGTATIYVIFLLGSKLFSKEIGLLASLLITVNPYHVYYSRDLQPYSAVCFFSALSLLFFALIIFQNKYHLAWLYLISITMGFFFHLAALLIPISHLIAVFVIWLKNKNSLFWKKNALFFCMVTAGFIYVFILWSPVYIRSTLVDVREFLTWNYFYFHSNIISTLALPFMLFQVVAGILPRQIILMIFIIVLFFCSLVIMKKKYFNYFVVILTTAGVIIAWFLYMDLYGFVHIRRFYRGYRWGISLLPIFSLVMAYSFALIKGAIGKIKKISISACLIIFSLSNLGVDYHIINKHRKPSYSQALVFVDKLADKGDIFVFPTIFDSENFLYYLNKYPQNYSHYLADALKRSFDYRSLYVRDHKERSTPVFVQELRLHYNRIWVADAREKFFERKLLNHEYADYLLDYLAKHSKLVLVKRFEYINIYLFDLRKSF
jgi:4-amino-4-deoxy-L-arabinose transferase-like glycosyltransferase